MAPHDDLTAERTVIIGKHYECEDSWYSCPVSDEGCINPGAGEACTCGVDTRQILLDKLLKTARQEAMREAYNIVEDWPLGIEDRLGLLDRLASEGAPAPIDLLHKFNDDGGYGEHF